jgi:hypothetical protein
MLRKENATLHFYKLPKKIAPIQECLAIKNQSKF